MKKIFSITGMAIICMLLISSCQKNKDMNLPPLYDDNTVTPVGTPIGEVSRKTIDAAGGKLTSADGTIEIIIPAGALNTATEISIQPISNELASGVGTAYRLTPHGEQFNKPVTITFHYKEEEVLNTVPELLAIAYQDEKGTWQANINSTIDKAQQKISVTTTHFSDWGFFKSIVLDPVQATVEKGGSVDLKVTTTFPYIDPDDAPPGTVPVYTTPRELRPDQIKGWSYSGDGILVSRAAQAFYTAPDHEPETNPEAVAVNINMHRKGQFMLVSNITVLADNGVDYLQVDEDYIKQGNNGKCVLYLYGSFGNDPGAAKRSVKIDGTSVEADVWAPTLIRCRIDREIYGAIEISANGKVVANSVLRKFTGKFLYERFHGGLANAGSSGALKETTQFNLVYRGFGKPCPPEVTTLLPFNAGLADGTESHFTLSGSAAVTTPNIKCPVTTSVTLPTSSGIQPVNPLTVSSHGSRFKCYVKDIERGIEVKIDYIINDVLTGVRVKRSDCNGSSLDPAKTLGVGLEGFHNEPINFEFAGTTGLKLMGTDKLSSNRLSSGILIEAWDGTGNPSHYETDGGVAATFKNSN